MSGQGVYWIVSYPKSGNTWLRCLMAGAMRGGIVPDINALHRHSPWPASRRWIEAVTEVPTADLTPAELAMLRRSACRAVATGEPIARLAAPEVGCLKIHDRYDPRRYPGDAVAGVVHVVRDPRDVALSWADQMNIPVDTAIAQMADPDLALAGTVTRGTPMTEERLGSWSDHAASWIDRYDGPRLLIRYEDLSARPYEQVARLHRFVGVTDDAAAVAATVAACRIDRLRSSERQDGFIERQAHQRRFFRSGTAGGWRALLPPGQAARIVADHQGMMARLGYAVARS